MEKEKQMVLKNESPERALQALADLRDAVGEASGENAEQIAAWEKLIKSHRLHRQWLANPITLEVFGKLLEKVASINRQLSTDGEMEELKRRGIFREKQAYLYLLTLFTDAKDDTVLDSLTEEIERRTQEFQDYNSRL